MNDCGMEISSEALSKSRLLTWVKAVLNKVICLKSAVPAIQRHEQAWEVGSCEPIYIEQGQVQDAAPGSGQPLYQYRLGEEEIESSPAEKAFKDENGWR